MTHNEFYETLVTIKHKYQWRINSQNRIRGRLIGATCDCCKIDFCPINAVAKEKYGFSNPDSGVIFSANELNLEYASAIVGLSDNAQYVENKIRDLLIT